MADQKFVTFLRELADWYESHPTVPEPYGFEGGEIMVYLFSHDDPKEVLRSIGSFDKSFTDSYFTARKQIGGKTLKFTFSRDKVCTPKVVGTRRVEAKIEPEVLYPIEGGRGA